MPCARSSAFVPQKPQVTGEPHRRNARRKPRARRVSLARQVDDRPAFKNPRVQPRMNADQRRLKWRCFDPRSSAFIRG